MLPEVYNSILACSYGFIYVIKVIVLSYCVYFNCFYRYCQHTRTRKQRGHLLMAYDHVSGKGVVWVVKSDRTRIEALCERIQIFKIFLAGDGIDMIRNPEIAALYGHYGAFGYVVEPFGLSHMLCGSHDDHMRVVHRVIYVVNVTRLCFELPILDFPELVDLVCDRLASWIPVDAAHILDRDHCPGAHDQIGHSIPACEDPDLVTICGSL